MWPVSHVSDALPHSKPLLSDVWSELGKWTLCIRCLSALKLRPVVVSPLVASIDSMNPGRSVRGEVIIPMNPRFWAQYRNWLRAFRCVQWARERGHDKVIRIDRPDTTGNRLLKTLVDRDHNAACNAYCF
jgi:hypothetical protein